MLAHVLEGNVLLKIVVLQLIVIVIVLGVLKMLLDRELLKTALERVKGFVLDGQGAEVVVVTAFKLSFQDEMRFKNALKIKDSSVSVVFYTDISLAGGLLIKMGSRIIDCSLLTIIKQLFKVSCA